MSLRVNWAFLILSLILLLGCDAGGVPFPLDRPSIPTPTDIIISTPTETASPTPAPPTPTDTPVVPILREPSNPTPVPPTATTASQARLLLTLPDCPFGFWDPFERERQIMNVLDKPGIVTVQTLGVTRVRLVYDPTQLSQEEAIRTFEVASGLEVIETDR